MKTPVSLRIEDDLLKAIIERGQSEGESSLNKIIENILGYYLLRNKYVTKTKVENYFKDVYLGGIDVISSDTVYILTNGLDFLVVDDIQDVLIENTDFVYECCVSNSKVIVKQITKF